MFIRSLAHGAVVLVAFVVSQALAKQLIPCAQGSGNDGGCGVCEHDMGIEATPWDNATHVDNFDLPYASSPTGAGYDVWWVSI